MTVRSLGAAVEYCARIAPQRGYRFIRDDKWAETFLRFPDVERETRQIAGSLQELDLRKGDRLALIIPDNDAFVLTFLGALRAGVIPVPIYPPTGLGQLSGYVDNTRHIVERSGSRALVTNAIIKPMLGAVQGSCPELQTITTYASLKEATAPFRPVDIAPDDIAFLQFTSGSTSRPKGVVLTHANLLANAECIITQGLRGSGDDDHGVTWLPLFHDMGLIGFVLSPLLYGIGVSFMSPLMFLKRPAIWLQAMSRFRGTITFGPNFAYALCTKRIKDRELEGVELSSWRWAGCGAEPIRPENLEKFSDMFGRLGFKKSAFLPAYGLAEATLAVAFAEGVPTDRVKASVLWEEGKAVPVEESSDDALRIVCCGKSFKNHEIGVFGLDDAAGDNPLPERTVGEIRLRGPSISQGYYKEAELTAQSFVNGWFRTGDLGYLAEGNLYICGRSKEVIIVNGRNFYPQDIEWEASQIEGVRRGNAIAFGTSGNGGDRECVILAFETNVIEPDQLKKMSSDIKARVQEVIGITLDEVVPLIAGALPKTSSGKLQRTKTRQLYDEGELTNRKSAREADRVDQVKTIAKSSLEYLRLAVFKSRKK